MRLSPNSRITPGCVSVAESKTIGRLCILRIQRPTFVNHRPQEQRLTLRPSQTSRIAPESALVTDFKNNALNVNLSQTSIIVPDCELVTDLKNNALNVNLSQTSIITP